VDDDTETKVASDVKAALARYRVLDSDLLGSLRRAAEVRGVQACRGVACVRQCVRFRSRVAIRPWSFLEAGSGVRS
jgi:hypothetical protein